MRKGNYFLRDYDDGTIPFEKTRFCGLVDKGMELSLQTRESELESFDDLVAKFSNT
jgi:hypothetical protein